MMANGGVCEEFRMGFSSCVAERSQLPPESPTTPTFSTQ
jgi:hypothetical protein